MGDEHFSDPHERARSHVFCMIRILPKPTGIDPIVTVNWFFGINNEKLKRKREKIIQVDQLGILKKEARGGVPPET